MNTGGSANTYQVTEAMEAHGQHMEQGLMSEMADLAQVAARRMRELAPKWRSELTNSIHVSTPQPGTWEIRPGVMHGLYRELGQPKGKGLPRFFDPAAKPIVDWLASKAFAGLGRVRRGSARFASRELELRDRYMGLSWHVMHKGLKAQPFVRPTHEEMAILVPQRMAAAAKRLLDQPRRLSVLLSAATARMKARGTA